MSRTDYLRWLRWSHLPQTIAGSVSTNMTPCKDCRSNSTPPYPVIRPWRWHWLPWPTRSGSGGHLHCACDLKKGGQWRNEVGEATTGLKEGRPEQVELPIRLAPTPRSCQAGCSSKATQIECWVWSLSRLLATPIRTGPWPWPRSSEEWVLAWTKHCSKKLIRHRSSCLGKSATSCAISSSTISTRPLRPQK